MPASIALGDTRAVAELMARAQVTSAELNAAETRHNVDAAAQQADLLHTALSRNLDRMGREHGPRAKALAEAVAARMADKAAMEPARLMQDAAAYATDLGQRALAYDRVARPCNYYLLRILPREVPTIDTKRPYVIIDPRAGHGPGIGGFKADSQVGVALGKGHPVYFVAFRPFPVPGQTLADVVLAEAAFVREIQRRHPASSKPIIIGNCQGGWATALLAATNPDLAGPVVFNGAPMAYWSGKIGENPMRYNGGLMGGVMPALLLADLGGGKLDGAWLVLNFEFLNPSRNFFSQYYDLFRDIDRGGERFLEFQKWWGGYFWMNEAEIRWIVEQLFVGNKLARGDAMLEHAMRVDMKKIRAPIIVFASHGDNITPPQQALNWIIDCYASEDEIKLAGQRIIYMVHDKVGHLGIFVSSTIAKREHSEMASTMKTIEALAPGLYEMVIEDVIGEGNETSFVVSFHKRRLADLAGLDDGRHEEKALAAVARFSAALAEVYEVGVRPMVKPMVSTATVEIGRAMHPLRLQRSAFASVNPMMRPVEAMAETVRAQRKPVGPDNGFVALERLWAQGLTQSMDLFRDMRDMMAELAFLSVWATPAMIAYGAKLATPRPKLDAQALRMMPEVQNALLNIGRGGYAEAVIRMLIMLAEARGSVRRDRLERSAKVLTGDAPFAGLGAERRAQIIQEQSIVVQFDPEAAIAALPEMLDTAEERARAIAVLEFVLGPRAEMEEHTVERLAQFRAALDLPPQPPGEGDGPALIEAAE